MNILDHIIACIDECNMYYGFSPNVMYLLPEEYAEWQAEHVAMGAILPTSSFSAGCMFHHAKGQTRILSRYPFVELAPSPIIQLPPDAPAPEFLTPVSNKPHELYTEKRRYEE